ncbi:integrase/recombinase xerD homolog [Mytilus trossulus]|uniref:integrase/recombinase xerD homolog n=1 Tax=Mytilus trossulus TaxID=6551 RepID=UPI003003A923
MTLFISTGIALDNTVKEAVHDSGIEVGSYMYELYPKMCELLINSKSDNTVKSYFNSYKRWERFITLQGHKSLPAQPVHVALYLTHLLNNNSTCHPISNAVYGIKWAHEINGLSDPTSNTFVTSILEASKRVAPKKTEKKDPITPETLIELCDMFKNSLDLLVVRDLTMMILSFSGFLRYDEVSSLRFCDVKVHESHLILCIEKSKTDQYRQSSEVLISKGNSSACPYTMFLRYTRLAGFSDSCQKFFYLFRPIYRSRNTCKLITKDKKLSYTAARESILKRIRTICPDGNIGLHSFRSGGATMAANADVSDRCLKKHGRWKSDSSKDGYIVDSTEKRLKISKVLGL